MFEEGFGNSRVTGLKEISLPEPVSMGPETVGWSILAGIGVLWLAYLISRLYQRHQSNRYRRLALDSLQRIETQWSKGDAKSLMQLPILLKRTAMHAFGREGVADLNGMAWLTFLDQTGQTNAFTQKPGNLIAILSYHKTATMDHETVSSLFRMTRKWITTHKEYYRT